MKKLYEYAVLFHYPDGGTVLPIAPTYTLAASEDELEDRIINDLHVLKREEKLGARLEILIRPFKEIQVMPKLPTKEAPLERWSDHRWK